jgi:hypothetical protein
MTDTMTDTRCKWCGTNPDVNAPHGNGDCAPRVAEQGECPRCGLLAGEPGLAFSDGTICDDPTHAPALPPEIAALLNTQKTTAQLYYQGDASRDEFDDANDALETAITALVRDGQAEALDDELHAEALSDLQDAQRALVLLANQLERHSVPFVPAAEEATAKARRDLDTDARLLKKGMAVAAAVLAASTPTPKG